MASIRVLKKYIPAELPAKQFMNSSIAEAEKNGQPFEIHA
jgi:hypothetical protein